ncbi:MAG TPA: alpha-amylase family glycosyl hydrolase [Candidatus Sulfotelmatobacter sp.]|nr:alpha-amylase family glycosyl hydrolase [Candidatus Sulfotelmatobacter sp.]
MASWSFTFLLSALAQQPASHQLADRIKSGVIYEVNPRTSSAAGDFGGVKQRLDYLKDLGVTILWIMPIHPVGQAKKKGSVGRAYAVQDYYAMLKYWLRAFDLDYAWPFHSTITDVLENGAAAQAIIFKWRTEHERYPKGALEIRFSDNHDEKRAIARFGERGAVAGSALVFTVDGVPMLYNGMVVAKRPNLAPPPCSRSCRSSGRSPSDGRTSCRS